MSRSEVRRELSTSDRWNVADSSRTTVSVSYEAEAHADTVCEHFMREDVMSVGAYASDIISVTIREARVIRLTRAAS